MFNNEHITFIVLKVLKSQVKCYPFITHLWGKVHYLVFMFKGFITRTINIYSSKIMNSTGIQNQGQNQVLPVRRLWPPGVLSVPDLSMCRNMHRPVPVFPCPWCMCGSLCVFTCVRACALWVSGGAILRGCPSGTSFPQGCTLPLSPPPPAALCPHIRISEAPAGHVGHVSLPSLCWREHLHTEIFIYLGQVSRSGASRSEANTIFTCWAQFPT